METSQFSKYTSGRVGIFCVPDVGLIPGLEDPLEKGKAIHSSILAWRIPLTV